MGMFDWYRPRRSLRCPLCDAPLEKWQGKDGPCELLVWQQGQAAPIDQTVDIKPAPDLNAFRLPPTFDIYSYDCAHVVLARCACIAGVWQRTHVDVKDAHRGRDQARWPPWWDWELELTPHIEKRMEDRGFDEVDLRAILALAEGYREDVVEGRYAIETHNHGDPWEVIVEPDDEAHALVVITAYRVSR